MNLKQTTQLSFEDYIETIKRFLADQYKTSTVHCNEKDFKVFALSKESDVKQRLIVSGTKIISEGEVTNSIYDFTEFTSDHSLGITKEDLADITLAEFVEKLIASQSGQWELNEGLAVHQLTEYVLKKTQKQELGELNEKDRLAYTQFVRVIKEYSKGGGSGNYKEFQVVINALLSIPSYQDVSWIQKGWEDGSLNELKDFGKVYSYGVVFDWFMLNSFVT